MAIGGAGLPIIGGMLGHSQPSSTAIYARLSSDPIRNAAENATNAIFQAGGVKLQGDTLVIDVASTPGDGAKLLEVEPMVSASPDRD
jgi:hypothetical protein